MGIEEVEKELEEGCGRLRDKLGSEVRVNFGPGWYWLVGPPVGP